MSNLGTQPSVVSLETNQFKRERSIDWDLVSSYEGRVSYNYAPTASWLDTELSFWLAAEFSEFGDGSTTAMSIRSSYRYFIVDVGTEAAANSDRNQELQQNKACNQAKM